MQTLLAGTGSPDLALLALRFILGGFFVLARFRWVYDPCRATLDVAREGEPHRIKEGEPNPYGWHGGRWFNAYRHQHLTWKLCSCGWGSHPCLAGFVALVEIFGGAAVVVGLLVPLASFGLLVLTLFATLCTARAKVARQEPVDGIDCASCYLWLVEPHLIIGAMVLMLCGAGRFSVDALLLAWWGLQ
jgi:uncharacterized membrane protein YphA (DoxX/SURF4 family)